MEKGRVQLLVNVIKKMETFQQIHPQYNNHVFRYRIHLYNYLVTTYNKIQNLLKIFNITQISTPAGVITCAQLGSRFI